MAISVASPRLLNICPHSVLFKKESSVLFCPPLLGFSLPTRLWVQSTSSYDRSFHQNQEAQPTRKAM